MKSRIKLNFEYVSIKPYFCKEVSLKDLIIYQMQL